MMPLSDYIIARANHSQVLRDDFETSLNKGYSAITKMYFYVYKLPLITSLKETYRSIDFTKVCDRDNS